MMRPFLTTVGQATALLMALLASVDVALADQLHTAPQILAQHGHGQGTTANQEAARNFAAGDLVVENPWARESVTRSGAVYLTVRNAGAQDDRLLGAASDVADRTEVHGSVTQDGVMRMHPVDVVDLPAGGEAVLAPGGLHVMLMGLNAPLVEGTTFPLVLEFERAGMVEVMVAVEDIAYAGSEGHHH